jgi:hypothetical protein
MQPNEEVFEKVGIEDIFRSDTEIESVLWHLLNLLGGKAVIPTDVDFWNNAIPADGDYRVVLRKEDGKLVLVAERRDWI